MKQSLIVVDNQSHPHVTLLGLNRPDKRNALSIALLEEFIEALEHTGRNRNQRVVILHGLGSVFCAGLDLEEASDKRRAHQSADLVALALKSLHNMPQVTIAAVQGAAMAGGAGLLCACDLVVAAEDVKIGFPETRRGLVSALAMTLLSRQVAGRHVRELLLLAEPVDALRAAVIGLVTRIVPAATLMKEALLMAQLVLHGAAEATAHTKHLIDEMAPHSLDADMQMALQMHLLARGSQEAEEGIQAFLGKRKPSWNI